MGCLFLTLLLISPRLGVVGLWLLTDWVERAFSGGWILPLLGIIFLPWTTGLYVLGFVIGDAAAPWGILGAIIGLFLDIALHAGDLLHAHHPAPAVAHALELQHDLERGRDLAAHRAQREIGSSCGGDAPGETQTAPPHPPASAGGRARACHRPLGGSFPCRPPRHDILCGALDFLWKPWGSIELWEAPVTRALGAAGVTTMLVTDHPHLFETGGENYHTDFFGWEYLRGHEGDAWRTCPDPTWMGAPARPAARGGWWWERQGLGQGQRRSRRHDAVAAGDREKSRQAQFPGQYRPTRYRPLAFGGQVAAVPIDQALAGDLGRQRHAVIEPVLQGHETAGLGAVGRHRGEAAELARRQLRVEPGKEHLQVVDRQFAEGL